MTLRWYTIVVDSENPVELAHWWAQTLDYQIVFEADDEVVIVPKSMSTAPIVDLEEWLRTGQGLVFVSVPEKKERKNRLHIDLAPHTSQDRDAEIAALIDRGARYADVGQDDSVPWTVLADPEGNEFCVLGSREL